MAERCGVCARVATRTDPNGLAVCGVCGRLADTVRDLMAGGKSLVDVLADAPDLVDEAMVPEYCHEHKCLRLSDGSCPECSNTLGSPK